MSPDAARAEDLRMDVGALLAAVLKRALRIAIVTGIVLAIAAFLLMLLPKTYESSASLLVEPRDNVYTRAPMESASGSLGSVSAEALMSSQIELIKSRDLLLEVMGSQNLRAVPEFSGVGFSPISLILQSLGRQPEQRSIDETVLGNLAERMTVMRERDSAVITVTTRSTDPDVAARLANAIAEAHVRRRAGQSLTDTAGATVWLQQEIERLREKVSAAETAVANFKVDNDMFVGANLVPVTDQQLSTLSAQIAEAQQRKNAAQSRADLIHGLVNAGQSLEGVSDVRGSMVIQSLLQTKANLQAELAQKSTTLLANHPTIKALKAQIAEIEDQVTSEGRRVAESLEAEAKVEAGLEDRLRADLARAKLTAGDATRGGVTLDGLQREAKAQRDLLENYLAKYSDAASRTAESSTLPDVRIISVAAPASQPSSPKIPLTLGAVAFVALALQIGAVLFGELMSGRALTERAPRPAVAAPEPPAADQPELPLADPPSAEPDLSLPVPAPVAADLDQLAAAVLDRRLRTVLLARLGDGDVAGIVDRLLDDTLAAGLSAVIIDAGSGEAGDDAGLTDLAAGSAEYGEVMQSGGESLAAVSWGRLATLDRRSGRPQTLVAALADVYHLVLVDTGRVGMASSLPLFAAPDAGVVLVAGEASSPVAVAAARRDIAALGFEPGRIVDVPVLRADVA